MSIPREFIGKSIATGLAIADHKHEWVISLETFWSEDGGDFRIVECSICDVKPDRGVLPIPWSAEVIPYIVDSTKADDDD